MTEEPKVEEEDTQIAPGLALAHAPEAKMTVSEGVARTH